MDLKVVSTTIGPDLTLWFAQIIQNHYLHDLHPYYKTTISYNLQPNYITFVLYNILKYHRYHLGIVVAAGS